MVLVNGVRVRMADDDSPRIHALLPENVQLVEPDGRVERVGGDRDARAPMRPSHRPEHALLDGRDPGEVGADLSQEARPDVGAVDPVGDVALELLGDLVGLGPPQPSLVVRLAVPSRPQDDLETHPLRDLADRERVLRGRDVVIVASEAAGRLVHQRHAAGLLVQGELAIRELGIVQHAVPAEDVAREVQEDVLVHQREAEVAGRDRPGHRHDGRHRSSHVPVLEIVSRRRGGRSVRYAPRRVSSTPATTATPPHQGDQRDPLPEQERGRQHGEERLHVGIDRSARGAESPHGREPEKAPEGAAGHAGVEDAGVGPPRQRPVLGHEAREGRRARARSSPSA